MLDEGMDYQGPCIHISNYLPIRARFPQEKEATLDLVDQALAGEIDVKPEWMRGSGI